MFISAKTMLIQYIVDAEKDANMKNISPKEAIEVLKDMKIKTPLPKAAVTQRKRNAAIEMAIDVLKYSELPNSSDLISRQTAIDAVAAYMPSLTTGDGSAPVDHDIFVAQEACVDCIQIIHDLPSAQPDGDMIRRQDAIDAVCMDGCGLCKEAIEQIGGGND